ncbi:MAG: aminomethyl-transferring glycine dehydrogenase subunit GcvPA [Steroidobacteraceae bacterium]
MSYIPHTPADVDAMLARIGVASIDDLFDEIPSHLKIRSLDDVPPAMSEMEITRLMQARAAGDAGALNFIGAGAYEHFIPAPVWAITTRGEFYSAYTPYQAEASQGTLQLIYEYQSMMTQLTAMEVANASLYDGASALAEACLMAVRAQRTGHSQRILVPRTLDPTWLKVARSIAGNQGLTFEPVDFDPRTGITSMAALEARAEGDFAALVIQHPNHFGNLEEVDALVDWAHGRKMLVIAAVNPVSLAILEPPGRWGGTGADIVCGEGQPLGCPLSAGGPYFGFMATRMAHVRQMPGRIVGRTLDAAGNPGFTLTLQAREQHIRRGKATSNICTNQGLLVTAASIHLSLLGAAGLARVAEACLQANHVLSDALTAIPGVTLAFDEPRFHETVLRLDRPVGPVLAQLAARGILGGIDLSPNYPELGASLLTCATETKTREDIERFAGELRAIMAAPAPRPA